MSGNFSIAKLYGRERRERVPGIHPISGTQTHETVTMSPKLRAALDYLGDKLSTHRASRFKPAGQFLLDEWLTARRAHRALLTQTVARLHDC